MSAEWNRWLRLPEGALAGNKRVPKTQIIAQAHLTSVQQLLLDKLAPVALFASLTRSNSYIPAVRNEDYDIGSGALPGMLAEFEPRCCGGGAHAARLLPESHRPAYGGARAQRRGRILRPSPQEPLRARRVRDRARHGQRRLRLHGRGVPSVPGCHRAIAPSPDVASRLRAGAGEMLPACRERSHPRVLPVMQAGRCRRSSPRRYRSCRSTSASLPSLRTRGRPRERLWRSPQSCASACARSKVESDAGIEEVRSLAGDGA